MQLGFVLLVQFEEVEVVLRKASVLQTRNQVAEKEQK